MSAFFSRRMMIILGVAVIAISVFKFDLFVIGPMVNSLVLLDKILFSNFGLAIIFFTVTVRLLMIPLTIMQTRNMRKMSALQPRMKAMQARYKDHPDGRRIQSAETMKMYKSAGVSPIGCLGPMVLQMPIWFGLYRAIFRAVPATPEGTANLSTVIYAWNPAASDVPLGSMFIGMDLVDLVQNAPAPFNFALPILVGASMWAQQKISAMPSMDERSAQTNQMMLWLMPIMFGFFTFQFPAGLAVYILFSNLIGVAITAVISGPGALLGTRFGTSAATAAAAVEAGVAVTEDEDKGEIIDGTATVLGEDSRRSDRQRARSARRKPRRRRSRRR
ncbi:MAG: YidC/Oxa1 family membrane protein insertase [Dehalococcoidia bacterium]|nr:YidC/Oxa1 family membrane protein insertase [Dehalococcoidia bacterium]